MVLFSSAMGVLTAQLPAVWALRADDGIALLPAVGALPADDTAVGALPADDGSAQFPAVGRYLQTMEVLSYQLSVATCRR